MDVASSSPMTAGTLLPGHGDPWTQGTTEAMPRLQSLAVPDG